MGASAFTFALIPFEMRSRMSCRRMKVPFELGTPINKLPQLTGTDVMQVGFSTDASPLQPFMIFELESISVSGVEYPIGTPVNRHTLSASSSNTCANGRNPISTSSG